MPVHKAGPGCYQWGNQKKYCGKGAKEKAEAQGRAIMWAKHQENKKKGKSK